MERVLPSFFHVLLPPAPKPRIRFHVTDDAVDVSSGFYQKVTQNMQTHPPTPILRAWLDDELVQVDISRPEALEVVWTCILEAGAAMFTHMRLLLEKYGPMLAQLMANDEDLVLVNTVVHLALCVGDCPHACPHATLVFVQDETRSVAAPRADDDVAPAQAHDLPELLLHLFRGLLRVLREHQAT
ncbi:hypothetical protein PsorP6_014365 [Peronosclerospora sorghi]|uniref:Uncharacterized protein n=1 Tax=Peronosclerospora sorghi TaxID=230839 RepID=A0ACC0VJF5_9STRA|nr:hypothetical protein PsorP6_014365 [Peronosclerospora sorghi]